MSSASREEKLRVYAARPVTAGRGWPVLAGRQTMGGQARGMCRPGRGPKTRTFTAPCRPSGCGRAPEALSGKRSFLAQHRGGLGFCEQHLEHFHPRGSRPAASDEAAYDCAMVLRAVLADPHILRSEGEDDRRRDSRSRGSRLLGAYVNDLEARSGASFAIPASWRGVWASTPAVWATEALARWFVASSRQPTA